MIAYLVLEQKGRLWYALPSCYCVLVGVVTALFAHKRIDFAAIVVFPSLPTLLGWGTAKIERRRH